MQLKLRHIILFILACTILIYAGTPGGALIAMAAMMQLALLIYNIELVSKSQWVVFKLFLLAIPTFIFWGAIQAFTMIYLKEAQYFFCFTTLLITFALSFILCLQVVFPYKHLKANHHELIATLQETFNSLKNERAAFIKTTLLLFVFSLAPWISSDWKLIFALMVIHLILNPRQAKRVFSNY